MENEVIDKRSKAYRDAKNATTNETLTETPVSRETKKVEVDADVLSNLLKKVEALEKAQRNSSLGNVGDLATAISEATRNKDAIDSGIEAVYDDSNVPVEDFLDKPVYMYTFVSYRPIFDDRKYGQVVKTPYGRPLVFKFTGNFPNGNGTSVPVATCKIETKKELAYLRTHTSFGKEIFERAEEAANVTSDDAAVISRVLSLVNSMTQAEVISRVRNEGIVEVSEDIEKMRTGLFNHLLSEEKQRLEQWNQINKKKALESQLALQN